MGAAASSVGTAKHGGAMVQMLLQVLQMGSSLSKDPTQHCAQPCGFSLGFCEVVWWVEMNKRLCECVSEVPLAKWQL